MYSILNKRESGTVSGRMLLSLLDYVKLFLSIIWSQVMLSS